MVISDCFYSVCTCLVSNEGGERLQRSVGVIEASHGFGPLEEQDVGHCHGPKPCGEAGGRWRRTTHENDKSQFSFRYLPELLISSTIQNHFHKYLQI